MAHGPDLEIIINVGRGSPRTCRDLAGEGLSGSFGIATGGLYPRGGSRYWKDPGR